MRNLIFKNLKMKNFRNHEEMDFEFNNGFTVITGDNGAGKTTIFDALYWTLYDTTTKGRRGDSVVRKRASKNCSVILEFSIENNEDKIDDYVIESYRKHSDHGNNKYLIKNGIDISGATKDDTNTLIESIILPPKVFLNCLLFSQYLNNSFTELTNSQQKDILDSMLGFEKYDEYYSKITDGLKNTKSDFEAMESSLPQLVENRDSLNNQLQEQNNNVKEYIKRQNQKEQELKETIDKLSEFISKNKNEIDKYEEIQSQLDKLNSELASIQEKKNSIGAELQNKKDSLTSEYNSKFSEKKNEIESEFQQKVFEVTSSISEIQNKLDSLNSEKESRKLKARNRRNDRLQEINENYTKSVKAPQTHLEKIKEDGFKIKSELEQHVSELKSNSSELDKLTSKLNTDNPKCYLCGQEIKDESLKKVKSKYENLSSKKEELQDSINRLEEERSKLREIYNKYGSEIEELDNKKEKEIKILDDKYNSHLLELETEYKEKSDQLNSQLNDYNKEKEKIEEIKNNRLEAKKKELKEEGALKREELEKSYSDELETIDKQIESKQQEINSMKEDRNKLSELKDKVINARATMKVKSEELSSIKSDDMVSSMKNQISKTEQMLNRVDKDMEEKTKKLEETKRKKHILEFWKKGFSDSGIRGVLLDESIPILNEKARELSYMTENIRVTFDSQRTLKSGDLRNQFSVDVIQTDNLTDDRKDLSGGEGRIVDIITLISLRYLLEPMYGVSINLFLFDEILDTLSPQNVDVALNIIRNISEQRSVVLISHTWRDIIECDQHIKL